MKEIPIVQCFDHNYVLPAGVAFQSMLEHAKTPDAKYLLHVIGTGLTDGDKVLLRGIVTKFPQASIFFHEPPKLDLPEYKSRGNLSKDVFYKMVIPDILPQYDAVIVSDVDVVYADDVATFHAAIHAGDNCYLYGTEDIGYAAWKGRGILRDVGAPRFFGRYERQMTSDEREKLTLGAGFMLMNSRKCREAGMPEKWMSFARNNFHRLVLLEQDVMNICCAPAVKVVSSRFMAIAGYEPAYRNLSDSDRTANPAWDEMFAHPVQIHYASGIKPWKYPQSACSGLWFEACMRAGLFDRWREWYDRFMMPQMKTMTGKKIFDIRLPLGRKVLHLQLHKERK